MAADPLDCNRQVYQANVFRKLDLVLHRDDGLEYDENGCMPCIPGCRKPVYESGQLITGYLLVRPTRKMVITGKPKIRWFIGDFALTPQYCEFVSKLSRQSVSPSTDHKFASSLSVNCHDSHFHRLPTMKFASSLSVSCHDSHFHRLATISSTYGR